MKIIPPSSKSACVRTKLLSTANRTWDQQSTPAGWSPGIQPPSFQGQAISSHLEIAARSIDGCHHPSYFWTCILNSNVTRYMFCLMTFAAHQSSFRTLKIWQVYFYSSSQHLNAILMSLKYSGLHFPSISLFNKGKPPNMSLNFQEFPANVTCFA